MANQFEHHEDIEFYFLPFTIAEVPGQYQASRLGEFLFHSMTNVRSERRKTREIHFNLGGWWLAPRHERLSTRERDLHGRLERVVQENLFIAVIDGPLMCERHAERVRDAMNHLLATAIAATSRRSAVS